jgi:alpha-tubulin suppressor-like RCC1 family protein
MKSYALWSLCLLSFSAFSTGCGSSDEPVTQPTVPTSSSNPTTESHPAQVIASPDAICVISDQGEVWCWGNNSHGQLATAPSGMPPTIKTPMKIAGLTEISHLAMGTLHTCAIKKGAVWCWGKNSEGELANGKPASDYITPNPTPTAVVGLTGEYTQLALGLDHSCALNKDGTVWCWGSNKSGQIGAAESVKNQAPTQVAGLSGVKSISSKLNHTCAIAGDDSLWCWGNNSSKQAIPSSAEQTIFTPQKVGVTNITKVSTGTFHTCAINQSGTAICWGDNQSGQIGNGKAGSGLIEATPVSLTSTSMFTRIDSSTNFTCASTSTQELSCWGANAFGQLASGTMQDQTTPTTIANFTNVQSFSVGGFGACAIGKDFKLFCWGNNSDKLLSTGSNETFVTPTEIAIPSNP